MRRPQPRLTERFYARPTLECAESLLGRTLVWESDGAPVGGVIVEVEAYIGTDDPACHAACGRTDRNRAMWGPPGRAYVYFTYGMHHCLNLVTEPSGRPAAVLVRALEPTVGEEILAARRPELASHLRLSGPGRICRGLGIGREVNGLSLLDGPLWVSRSRRRARHIERSPRIGIRRGTDREWRFYLAGSPSVTRRPRGGISNGTRA